MRIAYETLSNEKRRTRYDACLETGKAFDADSAGTENEPSLAEIFSDVDRGNISYEEANKRILAINTASGVIDLDGSIILNANMIAGYKFFIGDPDNLEPVEGLNALSGEVNYLSDFTLREDRLTDSFFEGAGANALTAEDHDTGVNVDLTVLGATGLLLQFQTQGNAPVVVSVSVIPEPSSIVLLGLGVLGVMAYRRCRTAQRLFL